MILQATGIQQPIEHRNSLIRKVQAGYQTVSVNISQRIQNLHKLSSTSWTFYALKRLGGNFLIVVPIALLLIIMICAICQQPLTDPGWIIFGLLMAIVGLTAFIEGLQLCLMPLGKQVGAHLCKWPPAAVLVVFFLLGILVTYAEPAMTALLGVSKQLTQTVNTYPYFYYLTHQWMEFVVLSLGVGMGLAAVLGVSRLMYGWSLRILVVILSVIAMVQSVFLLWYPANITEMYPAMEMCWDAGFIVTGPFAIPLLLSLGMGISTTVSEKTGGKNPLAGFGMVALASLCPVIPCQFLSILLFTTTSVEDIRSSNVVNQAALQNSERPITEKAPVSEILYGLRAVLPTFAVLMILNFLLKQKVPCPNARKTLLGQENQVSNLNEEEVDMEHDFIRQSTASFKSVTLGAHPASQSRLGQLMTWLHQHRDFLIGLLLLQVGMILFNLGINFGFIPLGEQAGTLLPATFHSSPSVPSSPFFSESLGKFLVILFTAILGLFMTRAEPSLYVFCQEFSVVVESLIRPHNDAPCPSLSKFDSSARLVDGTTTSQSVLSKFSDMYENGLYIVRSRELRILISTGVALGLIINMVFLMTSSSIGVLLFAFRSIILVCACIGGEYLGCLALDSGGVTTGPIVVPFLLSLSVAFGVGLPGPESGFGVVACVGLSVILTVYVGNGLKRSWKSLQKIKGPTPPTTINRV